MSGTSKGRKAICRKMKKEQMFVKCLLSRVETMGQREEF